MTPLGISYKNKKEKKRKLEFNIDALTWEKLMKTVRLII